MTTRRSFFSKVAAVIAAISIAPEIAFARKLEIPVAIEPFKMVFGNMAFWLAPPPPWMTPSDEYKEFMRRTLENKAFYKTYQL